MLGIGQRMIKFSFLLLFLGVATFLLGCFGCWLLAKYILDPD